MRHRTTAILALLLAAAATVLPGPAPAGAVPPSGAQPKAGACPRLDARLTWYGNNRARLQELIDRHGRCLPAQRGIPGKSKPLAVFDWDNTVVKNDVGDATTFWLLRNDKVLQPTRKDWRTTSPFLTPDAAAALRRACGTAVPAGQPLPTSGDTRCADEILSVYSDGATTAGAPAFAGYDHRRTEPSYAWAAQLLAGHTPRQVRGYAAAARAENLRAAPGTQQRVGTRKVTGWIRYYDQQRDLIRTLHRAGFDVWITSASAQPVVQVWAREVGIGADHVIGVENLRSGGRLTPRLRGCGGDPEAIPYIDGKRCAINRTILGVPPQRAFERQPAHRRQVFAAGDSDTDATFLHDATGLRLVLNRNKAELMCRAYHNGDGGWIVNPMFLEPKPALSTPYPCAERARVNPDGSLGPVLDDRGAVIPDQRDTVF
ncbi:haloacid dehalogenase-like hydrolase [Streptomyces sp. NPDC047097]|uniref:haloacid dehalogenase-like hydrolase n=1 Tax=Streptomyces sp. NPDC047097 TaxID=3155260 RepID=UPI0033CD0DF5